MLCSIFISLSIISGTLLTARGNIGDLNIIAVFSVIMNIVLNLILIPRFQALGSAYASMITQFFVAFFQLVRLAKIFRFLPGKRLVLQLFIFIIVIILTGMIVKSLDLSWFKGLVITGLSGPLTAFAIRLLTLREIKESLF
jgi:O-antigen/teichoic acid export membrane protein